MPNHNRLTLKIASQPEEFEQIHRLNYRTFVEEIPQHPANPEKLLVDRFHDENTYFICLDGQRLAGMLAMRANRPFSLDEKVADLDSYLPAGAQLCEYRLLAVEPEYRHPGFFAKLLTFAIQEGIKRGYTVGVASGTTRQKRLYDRMGFTPFAKEVGTAAARYQPMFLTLQAALELFERLGEPCTTAAASTSAISFMPGPVEISPAVQQAFAAPPVSHRSEPFLAMVAEIKQRLCELTGAAGVELLLGSGTLGNDAVGAHLKLLAGSGLVLVNGEFGERLVDHAERHALRFAVERIPWGSPFDLAAIERLVQHGEITWLWAAHCETSTGILNDLAGLQRICQRYGVRLCLDCTSSLGTVPVDLRAVYLASSVSGKGLASLPGIALVFYNHELLPDPRVPRYLDLGTYRQKQGIPFTHSSNLLAALQQALNALDAPAHFDAIRSCHNWLRQKLAAAGFRIIAASDQTSPAVITIAMPPSISAFRLGEELEQCGYLLSFRSSYLVERNLIQICLMGTIGQEQCQNMLTTLLQLTGVVSNHNSPLTAGSNRRPSGTGWC